MLKRVSNHQEQNKRPYQEDRVFVPVLVEGQFSVGIIGAVLDGHGGADVAQFALEYLSKNIVQLYTKQELEKSPLDLFKFIFENINNQMQEKQLGEEMGACVCIALLRKELAQDQTAKTMLYIANLGDTRGIYSKNWKAEALTEDHKATNDKEK